MDFLVMLMGYFYNQYCILYSKVIGNLVPGVLIPYRCFLLRSRTAVETVKHGRGKKRMNLTKRYFNRCLVDGTETVPRKSGKNGYLQVKNIAAPNLDTAHTFVITDGTDTYTVTASALSYAYTSVKNGDSNRQNLGKALYLYNQAADAHFVS